VCADKVFDFLVRHVVNFAVPALITVLAGASLWATERAGADGLWLAVLTTQGLTWLGLALLIEHRCK
jgi:hypothetical protein